MSTDRYLKAILTIIAIELGWIGLSHTAIPVAAQAAATPVIIRGIELSDSYRPLRIEAATALRVQVVTPVKVETDRPLKVESVPFTPSQRPGE